PERVHRDREPRAEGQEEECAPGDPADAVALHERRRERRHEREEDEVEADREGDRADAPAEVLLEGRDEDRRGRGEARRHEERQEGERDYEHVRGPASRCRAGHSSIVRGATLGGPMAQTTPPAASAGARRPPYMRLLAVALVVAVGLAIATGGSV